MTVPKGRAQTIEEKRAIIERVLRAWDRNSHLRLGQFLVNALQETGHQTTVGSSLFYAEDEALAYVLERFGTVV